MQVAKPKKGYKLVKTSFGKYEEIPEEWEVSILQDCGELSTGATPSRNKDEYWKSGTIPWMSSGEINKRIIFFNKFL